VAEPNLTAIALNCTLKRSPEPSSCELLLSQVLAALEDHGVAGELVRVADQAVLPGVSSDEGEGDAWPALRRRILDARILVLGTPIWLGQPSSVCKRVLERMDAFIGETDEAGRRVTLDRVAAVAVVGNEDGAHHVSAELYQALNDVGFTIPAVAAAYWTDEVGRYREYRELAETPEATATSVARVARHLVHLASALARDPYPAG
jgi:multimeric flavodoxin WrbA